MSPKRTPMVAIESAKVPRFAVSLPALFIFRDNSIGNTNAVK